MSHTNSTPHYELSQFLSTDTPGWLTDVNQDNSKIDTALYNNADAISTAETEINAINNRLDNNLPASGTVGYVLQKTATGAAWADLGISDNIFDMIYPVGSIYMTYDANFNPANTFGGSWTRIQDRFLLGAGSSYSSGSVGGAATHTLTTNEMPSHSHQALESNRIVNVSSGEGYTVPVGNTYGSTGRYSTTSTGGGRAHNNMPPYLVVNIWRRTA